MALPDSVFNTDLASFYQLADCIKTLTKEPWFHNCFQTNQPGYIPEDHPQKEFLIKCGLVDRMGRTQYRINLLKDKIFVTDGPWQYLKGGVFPWVDESKLILDYIYSHGFSSRTSGIVDPACGCGHTPIAYEGDGSRFALDINPRAGKFVKINSFLNGCQVNFTQNDISNGFPFETQQEVRRCPRLFAINMPHALTPIPNVLPSASDGGITGLKWTLAALRAIKDFQGLAVIHCYSLGDYRESRWDILEQAHRLFPPKKVRWKLLPSAKVWRVNGQKQQPNPMVLEEGLPKKSDCKLYVCDELRERTKQGYIRLVSFLQKKGWHVLGCGVLEVKL